MGGLSTTARGTADYIAAILDREAMFLTVSMRGDSRPEVGRFDVIARDGGVFLVTVTPKE